MPASSGSSAHVTQLSAAQAIAQQLSPRPSTVASANESSGEVRLKYSLGGCQPAPTGVVIEQSSKSVTLVLVGPALPKGESACVPNLVLTSTDIVVPSLDGRSVATSDSLAAS